ncbi:MAG: GTA-gp10 family protein [Pseudomonadota bacterium]
MNAARGEAALLVAGRTARVCLTLGALAEIEAALGCPTFEALRARLKDLSAGDLGLVLKALLRGGGEDPALAGEAAPGAAARAIAEAFERGLGD